MANLNIKLVKSLNGRIQKHKATAAALGLKKIGDVVEREDIPQYRGYVNTVIHLVSVEEVE